MKQALMHKLENVKNHISTHKRLYALSALTFIVSTLFSESVQAASAAAPDGFGEELYTTGLSWLKKIGKLGILVVAVITLVARMFTQDLIKVGLACAIAFVVIGVIRSYSTQLGIDFL